MSAKDLLDRARADASLALGRAEVEVVSIERATDAQAVSDLLNEVWQMPAGIDVLELSTLVALAHSGNYVSLARNRAPAREILAASVGFFGPPGQPLHSHITGVVSSAVGRGIGRAMKLYQRAWALERGVSQITWTFDPLVARNAFFNLTSIGARAVAYFPDHYGPMIDGLNAGQGSDRMLMRWDLRGDPTPAPEAANTPGGTLGGAEVRHVEIPDDIEALRRTDPAAAMRWRADTRAAFTDLLSEGWRVVGIERPARYILTKEPE